MRATRDGSAAPRCEGATAVAPVEVVPDRNTVFLCCRWEGLGRTTTSGGRPSFAPSERTPSREPRRDGWWSGRHARGPSCLHRWRATRGELTKEAQWRACIQQPPRERLHGWTQLEVRASQQAAVAMWGGGDPCTRILRVLLCTRARMEAHEEVQAVVRTRK